MIGIYKITNTINGKSYIGQSNNIEKRFKQHKSDWASKDNPDKPLYKAFHKYGVENFSFEVIEECPENKLDEREVYWISFYQSMVTQHGYNIRSGGEGNSGENHPRYKVTEADAIGIRTRYNNHEKCKEVRALYKDKIGDSGFSKIWKGETWPNVMPEVCTPENKNFHLHNTGQQGSQNARVKLTEQDVINIRTRKKNKELEYFVYQTYKDKITYGTFKQIWQGRTWKHVIVE